MEQGIEDRIVLISTVCYKLAEVLKDPTDGGKKELSSDARTHTREDAYDDLITCIDVLAAGAHFNQGIFDVFNIVSKYKCNVQQ